MFNGRPTGAKKTVRLMVALTILAWATQTLLHQWGYGEVLPIVGQEKFVPNSLGFGCTLELRSDAKIVGQEVKFRQIFRWANGDKAVFQPIADLPLAKFKNDVAFQSLSLEELRQTLRESGFNIAMIRFAGAMSCRVVRSDVSFDERIALDQWIQSKQVTGVADQPVEAPAPEARPKATASGRGVPPVPEPTPKSTPVNATDTLRTRLTADLAQRLNLPADSLQLTFDPKDERLLNLTGPTFRFYLNPTRARNLGSVIYEVTIATDSGSQKVTISADARAWQTQVLAERSIAFKQVIRAEDITERRVLIDHVTDEPVLARTQIVGQQASRDIKTGMMLTGRMIETIPLVKLGQLVTIHLVQGTVQLTSVARAMENGAYGQTIKAKNEMTKDIFEVVVIGPQTASMGGTDLASVK